MSEDVNSAVAKTKKKSKLILIVAGVCVVALVGGFFVLKGTKPKDGENPDKVEVNISTKIKDYPENKKDAGIKYSRPIAKQTYMLKTGGVISFEAEIVFYNRLCANLYNGIDKIKDMEKTVPTFTENNLGDKRVKSLINEVLQETSKEQLSSSAELSEVLKNKINSYYLETYNEEIVEEVLVLEHIIK